MNGECSNSQFQIRTPEGVSFAFALASPVARALAYFVDLACILTLAQIVSALAALFAFISLDLYMGLQTALYFVISIGYGIATEWFWSGQTLGKRLLRLRVMDAQGLRLVFSQIVVRNLLRAIDSLPVFYLVGGAACLLSPRAQRLGDLAAGTLVVRVPRLAEPDLTQLTGSRFNSLETYPHLAARLRQSVSPAEAALILRALMGRAGLEDAARLELYGELAAHFRAKVAFPQEATDGLSDEQYLRNVAAIVFRTRPAV